jgi:CcmD family protein
MTPSQLIGLAFVLIVVYLLLLNNQIAKLEERIEKMEQRKGEG